MSPRVAGAIRAPLPMPNASQASETGKISARAKTPPPTMKFRGAWSLNRNSSPGWSAPEISAPARLPEIHFFDAWQRRQISKPFVVGDPNVEVHHWLRSIGGFARYYTPNAACRVFDISFTARDPDEPHTGPLKLLIHNGKLLWFRSVGGTLPPRDSSL